MSSSPESGKDLLRLNRFIANAGVCSRREADRLIEKGDIKVNGKVTTELGTKVSRSDSVIYRGKRLSAEKQVYILLNKPKDFITTTKDPEGRRTVMQLIKSATNERVYPVGRLDRKTTGLLLFTNDGKLAEKLTHPSHQVKKIYKVVLNRPFNKSDEKEVSKGLALEEGVVPVDDFVVLNKERTEIGLELHVGWNRVIRRLFEKLDYEVVYLDRVVYAGLDKKDLPRGKWRMLTPLEVRLLKSL